MSSIYLRNDGSGNWTATDLPLRCQTGPIKAILANDVNRDGHLDFIYAGNHFPTEVETARYDGLFPGVCLGDGKGNFMCKNIIVDSRLEVIDVRDIKMLNQSDGAEIYLLSINNGKLIAITIP
jgi:hypothetical protein